MKSFAMMMVLGLGILGMVTEGCGGTEEQDPLVVAGVGKVRLSTPVSAGRVHALWQVSSKNPDYSYKFGEGSSTGDTFTLLTQGEVPEDALESYGIGIAILVLTTTGCEIPEGKIAEDELGCQEPLLGYSAQYAMVYKVHGASELAWIDNFDDGLSCAKCIPDADGDGFADYAPVACAEVEIVDITVEGCNAG